MKNRYQIDDTSDSSEDEYLSYKRRNKSKEEKIIRAIRKNKVKRMTQLIEDQSDVRLCLDPYDGNNVLHEACRQMKLDIIKFLV